MADNTQKQTGLQFIKIRAATDFPGWLPRPTIVSFFHETMKPYEDKPADIEAALDYAFSDSEYAGGFLMVTHRDEQLAGALLMLNSGMRGYIPENILLFVTVNPEMRGQGIGAQLIERCVAECDGDVKLHVDFDNPAKRLYERLGFKHCYAEMRLKR
ncbi:GNAT family N-acetyltransferase [bacterium]|nr:GNAT family N-acetyltransferase [bacterium]